MHFKTHFGDLLTAEQEKILLETSELFNESILNLRFVDSMVYSIMEDNIMHIYKKREFLKLKENI